MAEKNFNYQCQHCGTLYNDPQAECPYCGEPQPFVFEDEPFEEQDGIRVEEEHYLPESDADHEAYYSSGDDLPSRDRTAANEYFDDPYSHEDTYIADLSQSAAVDLRDYTGHPKEEEPYYDDPSYESESYPHPRQRSRVGYRDPHDEVGEFGPTDQFEDGVDEASWTSRFTWRRMSLGCLGTLLCVGLFFGGVGLLAVRQGLSERAVMTQAESDEHYQKGLEHLDNDEIDLAIAELELAVSINPNHAEARQALRRVQRIEQARPTPTSETRLAAAADLMEEATAQVDDEQWAEAAQTLLDIRDLDPEYEAAEVSDLIYQANYNLGTQLLEENQLEEALSAFELALAERPRDAAATVEQFKLSLYLEGLLVAPVDAEEAIDIFRQVYTEDQNYLDVEKRLAQAYETFGDELAEAEDWCNAEIQFLEANDLQRDRTLQRKIDNSNTRCEDEDFESPGTPVVRATSSASQSDTPTVTPAARATSTSSAVADAEEPQAEETEEAVAAEATAATEETSDSSSASVGAGGSIIYSAYNPSETRWEILSVPADGGSPKTLVTDGKFPALSPDGKQLLYRTERIDAIGLHIYDLTTGQNRRVTIYAEHTLPRWGGNNTEFVFSVQEPGTGRWLVYQGFADGKGDPVILGDGRTPAWSPNGDVVAFQGTDPQGNNPGIYLMPLGGGKTTRLTTHESDRSPAFSPDGSKVAYMSTRSGNWDVYVVNTGGGEPRQITTSRGNDGLPTWSPDGSQIAYVSDSGGSWGIWRINAGGGEPVRVTDWDGRRSNWLMAQIWWGR